MIDIDSLYRDGVLSDIDRAFARMVHRISNSDDPWVGLAAGLVSRAAAKGDVCIDLQAILANGVSDTDTGPPVSLSISLKQWTQKLLASSVVGIQDDQTPMILNGNRLYLQRYWNYERRVAQAILERCRTTLPAKDATPGMIDANLQTGDSDQDQLKAVSAALQQRFTVISGGPGTGKTTTVAKIILHLLGMNASGKTPRIALAAPTGKAAARMQEALDRGFSKLIGEESGQPVSEVGFEARTLHRLLGAVPGTAQCRFHRERPLPADVVIVDEASMIDLAMMAKLIEAVPSEARLILVGDKDQLASVEAGAVLGDICNRWKKAKKARPPKGRNGLNSSLSDHIVFLQKSYRFKGGSGIEALSRAVNSGDGRKSLELLETANTKDISLNPMAAPLEFEAALEKVVAEHIAPVFSVEDALQALARLNDFKILSPIRKGPDGVVALNRRVERILKRLGIIGTPAGRDSLWYPGRPVIIQRNDYHQMLFNGDVGITIDEKFHGRRRLWVAFPEPNGGIRMFSTEQLPPHETVYTMTVHKSQGTEFNDVLLVLPEKDTPAVTRELIYTAVTRARNRVEIWGRPSILMEGVRRRVRRTSGLREAIWGDPTAE